MVIPSNFPAPAAGPLASILSLRRTDDLRGGAHRNDEELDAFLRHVAGSITVIPGDLLSLRWIGDLLGALLSCFEEFLAVLSRAGSPSSAPTARALADFFGRGVKALDVCSAARDGAAEIRECRRRVTTAVASVVVGGPLSDGRLRRARRSLAELGGGDAGRSGAPRRNRSFGNGDRRGGGGSRYQRSQSWSFSRPWTVAARQQQVQGVSFPAAPRGHEMAATEGLAEAVYAMGQVLAVVMGALAAALPSSSSPSPSLHETQLAVPRAFAWWSAPVASLHERILEEAKRKKEEDKQRCSGAALLKEARIMERRSKRLMDLIDAAGSPVSGEEEAGIRVAAEELREASEAAGESELERVEKQIRAVFQSIMRLRKEGLDGSPKFSLRF